MSANVDQRSKGQPGQMSNGKDVKDDDPYLQAPHQIRSWSDQTSDTPYGATPMSATGVTEPFFQNFYPPNMTYPFMNQGLSGSEGPWSNGTDTMFGMGYDYNVYGGFGFPFNSWDYSNDYWNTSQGVRKDQRGYPAEEGYYPPEMLPHDAYGAMLNGVPPEPQEPIGTVEQGLRGMTISSSNSSAVDPQSSRKKMVDVSQPPVMSDNFSGGDSPHTMSSSHSQSLQSASFMSGGGQGPIKKTSWAAIASQPARPQPQFRPRTIPRAPVNPNRPHNMDIGTWDGRGNPNKTPLAPPPVVLQPSTQSQSRQNWPAGVARSNRPAQPYSTSGPGTDSTSSSPNLNSNINNNSGCGSGGSITQTNIVNHSPPNYSNNAVVSTSARNSVEEESTTTNGDNQLSGVLHPVIDQLKSSNLYNPKEFSLNSKSARIFIIKSYSEDDIHRSIKYNIWCSTDHGNKRLDDAYREREGKGPIYLIFSVNGSGHFCGVAQMVTAVDYNKSAGVWAQDKWKGQFTVKWIYVKDVPNSQLRHIRLENNENKPVTNSRDTQEVPPEKGKQVLRIIHSYKHSTSIFDDFSHYEKRQEQDASSSQPKDHRNDSRNEHRNDSRNDHRIDSRNDHRIDSRNDHRIDSRNDPRNDSRNDHRNDSRNDHRGNRDRDRGDGFKGGDRDRGESGYSRGGDRDRGEGGYSRGGERDRGEGGYRGGDRERADGTGGRNRDNRDRDNRRGVQDIGGGDSMGRGNAGIGRSGRQN